MSYFSYNNEIYTQKGGVRKKGITNFEKAHECMEYICGRHRFLCIRGTY